MIKKFFLLTIMVILTSNVLFCQQKTKDYLVAKIQQPTWGAAMKRYAGLNIENTQFLSKWEYRNTPIVINNFTDYDGNFMENDWNTFYDLLEKEWTRFCHNNYYQCSRIECVHSKYDLKCPENIRFIEIFLGHHTFYFWEELDYLNRL